MKHQDIRLNKDFSIRPCQLELVRWKILVFWREILFILAEFSNTSYEMFLVHMCLKLHCKNCCNNGTLYFLGNNFITSEDD